MECKLVIKNSDSLCVIYLTIFSKVLIRRVVLNFYIYKELFGLINLTLKIFYAFILNQKALKIDYSDFIISDILSQGEVQSTSTLNDWAGCVNRINRQDLT